MPCQILVAYQCSVPVGEVVGVFNADEVFSKYVTLAAWGDKATWHRNFTLIMLTDKTRAELLFLLEKLPEGHDQEGVGRYYFAVPAMGTPEYTVLNATGEISCDWATVLPYLLERS